jgi:hypothetical protein
VLLGEKWEVIASIGGYNIRIGIDFYAGGFYGGFWIEKRDKVFSIENGSNHRSGGRRGSQGR